MDEYEDEVYNHRLRRMALDPLRPRREKGTQTDPVGVKWLIKHREKASHEARKNFAFRTEQFDLEYPKYKFSSDDSDSGPDVSKPFVKKLKKITLIL